MRNFLLAVLMIFSASSYSHARNGGDSFLGHLQVGCEWGYSQLLYQYHDYNIVSVEGYRIKESSRGFNLHSNGFVLLNVGYDIGQKMNVGLYAGYAGIAEDSRFFPAFVRFNFHPSGTASDGFFSFIDGGAAVGVPSGLQEDIAAICGIGEGYRIKLNWRYNLDFHVALRYSSAHPSIPNPDGPGYVSRQNIRSNSAGYLALNFAIAINF